MEIQAGYPVFIKDGTMICCGTGIVFCRITKRVFNHDYRRCQSNWSSDIKTIMTSVGLADSFDDKKIIHICNAKAVLRNFYSDKWKKK